MTDSPPAKPQSYEGFSPAENYFEKLLGQIYFVNSQGHLEKVPNNKNLNLNADFEIFMAY